jgi:hypothetical protein
MSTSFLRRTWFNLLPFAALRLTHSDIYRAAEKIFTQAALCHHAYGRTALQQAAQV